jgi:hypothetical protein
MRLKCSIGNRAADGKCCYDPHTPPHRKHGANHRCRWRRCIISAQQHPCHWVRRAQHVQLQLSCAAGSACTHWPPTMLQMLASQSQLNHHNSPLEPQHQVGGRWPNRQSACAAEELKLPGACKGWQNTCWRPGADSRACGRCPQGISACSSSVSSELLYSTYRCKRGIKTHWQGFCSPLCAWFPCALPKQAKYPAAECASTGKQHPAHWQWPARRASAAATRQGTGTKLLLAPS